MDPSQGGVVEAVHQAAAVFNDRYSTMHVLCLDAPDSEWLAIKRNYKIFPIGKGYTKYGFHSKLIKWVWSNSRNYDIVIIDGIWQFSSVSGYLLYLLKVPYCVFIHGMLSPYFNRDRLKYFKKLPFWFSIERNVIAGASAVIFTCQEELDLATNSFPFYRSKPVITPLGVEICALGSKQLVNTFYQRFPMLKDKNFALFMGRIHPIKGLDLLIDALAELKNLPDDFVLAIAGPDHHGLKEILEKNILDRGLRDRVIWLDMLTGNLKWGALHCADVFILPSHQENFGIVVAEALATGTPVLITDKVNIWKLVADCSAGFVESDDLSGIGRLLEFWFQLPSNKKMEMRIAAKNCFEVHFSKEVVIDNLKKILQEVIS